MVFFIKKKPHKQKNVTDSKAITFSERGERFRYHFRCEQLFEIKEKSLNANCVQTRCIFGDRNNWQYLLNQRFGHFKPHFFFIGIIVRITK